MGMSRRAFLHRLGAVQANDRWAWCAVDHTQRIVYVSMWTTKSAGKDKDGNHLWIIQEPYWGQNPAYAATVRAARADQDAKLDLVFNEGYQVRGYVIVPVDRTNEDKIKEFRDGFYFKLDLTRMPDGVVMATIRDRVNL